MKVTKRFVLILSVVALAGTLRAQAPQKRAIAFDDLISVHRVSDVQVSPDGAWVSYTVAMPDKEANRTTRNLWLVSTAGGEPKQMTRSGRDSHARWSPDSSRLAFVSSRDGSSQIYLISLEGGEASKVTSLSTGAAEVTWSPDGNWLAFTSEVYPDCRDDACNSTRDAEREKSKVKARIYDQLLYRHWDTWEDGKRSHVFVVPSAGGTPRDLNAGADYDVPPVLRGGPTGFAFSPDSKEVCFVAVTDTVEAISTNGDLFVVSVQGGETKRITSNPGFDSGPVYSPDGRTIAYRSQLRASYESDRWRLMLYDRQSGRHTDLTENFDRSVDSYAWSPDSKTIYSDAEDRARKPIFSIPAAPGNQPRAVLKDAFHGEFVLSADGKMLVFTRTSQTMPAEIFAANSEGSGLRQLTRHNAARLAALDLAAAEHFWFAGADGTQVQGMLVRPPGFDPAKKYPLLLLAHGGPQTMWSDTWSYRWNAQLFASPGYVVVQINRRGSTGYGQKFTDEIIGDYGGKAYQDLMKGVDFVLAKYPFVDGTRMAAAGASFGGFMMNWFSSQSKGRFKAIVSHAGVYNQESFYGATEELWFPEWDFRGTPWTNEAMYEKWSPHKYAGEFSKYKTPTLVIHGEHDYRVPYTESLQMFTALQRQGVPSKLLMFPDEGHWILKPQNSELWYSTVLDWLGKFLK